MGQSEEQEKDSWNAFWGSGKVEDYLRYASRKSDEGFSGTKEFGIGSTGGFHEITEGVKNEPYAGYYSSDRDYSQTESYR